MLLNQADFLQTSGESAWGVQNSPNFIDTITQISLQYGCYVIVLQLLTKNQKNNDFIKTFFESCSP